MKPKKKLKKPVSEKTESWLFYFFAAYTILFIPVLHVPRALDQAMMPRMVGLSALIFIATAVLLFRNYKAADLSVLRVKIFPVMIAYLAVVIISITFALNYRESFYDIVRTFILVAIAPIAAVIFSRTTDWQGKLPKFVMGAAVIALAIGTYQYFKHVIFGESDTLDDGREIVYLVAGLMFHKNEYSTALVLMLPFLGYGILSYRDGWRVASILITLYILVMIVLVKTRSVWIGLALAMIVLSVIVSLYSRKLEFPRWFRNIVIGSLAAGAVTVAVIYSLPKPDNPYSILGRIRYLGDMSVGENRHRVNIWSTTIDLIKTNPIQGVGAGNWRLHAAYYFDGRFQEVPHLNWARPHNDFLWVWAEKGIFGIVLFLLMFGLLIYYQLAIIRKSPHTHDKILASLLMATVVIYLTISAFSFPYERLNHQMYLALIIGATASMYSRVHTFKPFRPQAVAIFIPILAFSFFGMAMGYRTTNQEVLLNKSISAMHHEDWRVMLNNARAAQGNPFRSLDPLSNPPEYYEGMALAKLGRHAEAVVAYEKAKAQFPNNMWIINWLGQSYYHVGRYDDAIECLNKVLKILPDFREAYINLSATYYAMGDYKNSHEALARIPGWENDDAVVRNMRVLENMMRRQAEGN